MKPVVRVKCSIEWGHDEEWMCLSILYHWPSDMSVSKSFSQLSFITVTDESSISNIAVKSQDVIPWATVLISWITWRDVFGGREGNWLNWLLMKCLICKKQKELEHTGRVNWFDQEAWKCPLYTTAWCLKLPFRASDQMHGNRWLAAIGAQADMVTNLAFSKLRPNCIKLQGFDRPVEEKAWWTQKGRERNAGTRLNLWPSRSATGGCIRRPRQ